MRLGERTPFVRQGIRMVTSRSSHFIHPLNGGPIIAWAFCRCTFETARRVTSVSAHSRIFVWSLTGANTAPCLWVLAPARSHILFLKSPASPDGYPVRARNSPGRPRWKRSRRTVTRTQPRPRRSRSRPRTGAPRCAHATRTRALAAPQCPTARTIARSFPQSVCTSISFSVLFLWLGLPA